MALLGFQTLHCPTCSKTHVVSVGELVWQEGKGQAIRVTGYYCISCMKPFDTEGAIKTVKTKELTDKIKELEAQHGR